MWKNAISGHFSPHLNQIWRFAITIVIFDPNPKTSHHMEHISIFEAFGLTFVAAFIITESKVINIVSLSIQGKHNHDITSVLNDDPLLMSGIKQHIRKSFIF